MKEQKSRRQLWTKESILDVENRLLQQILAARTPEETEAAVAFAEFLRWRGLDAENYPVFLKMLTSENPYVLDALIGSGDPFELFADIPPNTYVLQKCFELLERWPRGGIHPSTLGVILGILRRAYLDERDGYRLHAIGVADVNNLGKHLDESEGQRHPLNRAILDILDNIGSLEGSGLQIGVDTVARQAVKIRSFFLDNTRSLEGCLPGHLMETGDYRRAATPPRHVFVD